MNISSIESRPTHRNSSTTIRWASWFARIALAVTFLSAVADRFGMWGSPGTEGVAWGSIEVYESYVAQLNWFLPAALISTVGWITTILEIVIAIGLLIGWRLRYFSLAAGVLLMLFASAMLVAFGPKPPLDYSVFSAASAAFLLHGIASPGTAPGNHSD